MADPLKHVCGSHGYGLGPDDFCAACDDERFERNRQMAEEDRQKRLREKLIDDLKIQSLSTGPYRDLT